MGRFSSRFDWEQQPNRLTESLRNQRAAGVPILDLTESNPTRAGLEYDATSILAALGDPAGMVYEPDPAGIATAREAVAEYYAGQGHTLHAGQLILTASTSEAYSYLFRLLTNPGDEVLIPAPSYPLFEFLGGMDAVRLRAYRLSYQAGWWLDFESVFMAISERTRAILLVNPNNPTGSYIKPAEMERLAGLCRDHDLTLIIDEVFWDFPLGASTGVRFADYDNIPAFTLSGLSKVAGLPQMKLGWIAVHGPAPFRQAALHRLEIIADTYLSVSAPVQHAARTWLRGSGPFRQRLSARLRENLATLRDAAAGSPVELLDVEGGWYATLRLPRTRGEEKWVLDFLERDRVLVQPGYFFDFESEAYVVVSLLTPTATLKEGASRIIHRVSA